MAREESQADPILHGMLFFCMCGGGVGVSFIVQNACLLCVYNAACIELSLGALSELSKVACSFCNPLCVCGLWHTPVAQPSRPSLTLVVEQAFVGMGKVRIVTLLHFFASAVILLLPGMAGSHPIHLQIFQELFLITGIVRERERESELVPLWRQLDQGMLLKITHCKIIVRWGDGLKVPHLIQFVKLSRFGLASVWEQHL